MIEKMMAAFDRVLNMVKTKGLKFGIYFHLFRVSQFVLPDEFLISVFRVLLVVKVLHDKT